MTLLLSKDAGRAEAKLLMNLALELDTCLH